MNRKKFLIELMTTTKARASELKRYLATIKEYRHLSFSGEKFYTDMIDLNTMLGDRAEEDLYINHKYGRKTLL